MTSSRAHLCLPGLPHTLQACACSTGDHTPLFAVLFDQKRYQSLHECVRNRFSEGEPDRARGRYVWRELPLEGFIPAGIG
jgi:hypothetical protein